MCLDWSALYRHCAFVVLAHCFEQITCAAAPMALLRPVLHARATMRTSARHAPGIFTSVVPAVAWAPECSVGQHQMQSPSNTEDHVCSGPGSVFLLVIFTRLKFPSVPWMFCASDMLFICPLGHCFEQITCAAAPMVLLRPVTHAHVTMPTSAQHAPGIFT